jgi:hypothetical protein
MKTFLAMVLASFLAPAQPDSEEPLKIVHQQAQVAANAVMQENFETLADLTYPKVVAELGGKDRMVATLKRSAKEMKAQGVTVLAVKAEAPNAVFRAERELMTVVPQSLELAVPDGKLKAKSFLVGISSDRGATWTFIDGGIGEARIRELVPSLPRQMVLPQPQRPVLEKK